MVNFNAFVDCKALDAKNGVLFKWYSGEMTESPDMEKDPLVLDTIRTGVDLTCTKKGVQKPTYFRPIGETKENRLKIDKELEDKIVVCLACPIVGNGEPSISGKGQHNSSVSFIYFENNFKPIEKLLQLQNCQFLLDQVFARIKSAKSKKHNVDIMKKIVTTSVLYLTTSSPMA